MDIDLELPINWEILGNPLNWLIVVMILIAVSYSAYVVHANSRALIPQLTS